MTSKRDEEHEKLWEAAIGREWVGMPQFESNWARPWKQVLVGFATREDYERFKELVEQPNMTDRTKSIWYPVLEDLEVHGQYRYAGEETA